LSNSYASKRRAVACKGLVTALKVLVQRLDTRAPMPFVGPLSVALGLLLATSAVAYRFRVRMKTSNAELSDQPWHRPQERHRSKFVITEAVVALLFENCRLAMRQKGMKESIC
jgi:hypothetical protein